MLLSIAEFTLQAQQDFAVGVRDEVIAVPDQCSRKSVGDRGRLLGSGLKRHHIQHAAALGGFVGDFDHILGVLQQGGLLRRIFQIDLEHAGKRRAKLRIGGGMKDNPRRTHHQDRAVHR